MGGAVDRLARADQLSCRRMRRSASFGLIAAAVLVTAGCSLGSHSTTSAGVGDSCLVSDWVLADESNSTGYTYAGVPVAVDGLAGTKLTISSAGEEKEDFDGSRPLVGTLADGRVLSITIGGSIDFHIHASAGTFAETGTKTNLPTEATVDGSAVSGYQSFYEPAQGTYKCTAESLTMTTSDNVQTTTWSKG
jgi:hypothetical protein